jgi:hypothetical protein
LPSADDISAHVHIHAACVTKIGRWSWPDWAQTYLSTDMLMRKRVWVNWGKVTSFEVSEADAY